LETLLYDGISLNAATEQNDMTITLDYGMQWFEEEEWNEGLKKSDTDILRECGTLENAKAWNAKTDQYLFAEQLILDAEDVEGKHLVRLVDALELRFESLLDNHYIGGFAADL
jgi:hypothetical protein